MLKVRIDRAAWDVIENKRVKLGRELDGNDYAGKLHNYSTKLNCCLGFVGLACDFSIDELSDKDEPGDLDIINEEDEEESFIGDRDPRWPVSLFKVYGTLMEINDNVHFTAEEKETQIIETGKQAGIDFEFYGEYLKG